MANEDKKDFNTMLEDIKDIINERRIKHPIGEL